VSIRAHHSISPERGTPFPPTGRWSQEHGEDHHRQRRSHAVDDRQRDARIHFERQRHEASKKQRGGGRTERQGKYNAQQERPQVPMAATRFWSPSLIQNRSGELDQPVRNVPTTMRIGPNARFMYFWSKSEISGRESTLATSAMASAR